MIHYSQKLITMFRRHMLTEQEVALLEDDTEHGKDFKKRKRRQRYVREVIWKSEQQLINGEALETVCILGVAVARPGPGRHGSWTKNFTGAVKPVFRSIQAKRQGSRHFFLDSFIFVI